MAFAIGRRAPSRRYAYGFGRAEDLAGVFIVAMIVLSALLAGWESIRNLIDPQPLTHAGIVAFCRIRVERQIGSAALVADRLHARTGGFTSWR